MALFNARIAAGQLFKSLTLQAQRSRGVRGERNHAARFLLPYFGCHGFIDSMFACLRSFHLVTWNNHNHVDVLANKVFRIERAAFKRFINFLLSKNAADFVERSPFVRGKDKATAKYKERLSVNDRAVAVVRAANLTMNCTIGLSPDCSSNVFSDVPYQRHRQPRLADRSSGHGSVRVCHASVPL